jgi:Menin
MASSIASSAVATTEKKRRSRSVRYDEPTADPHLSTHWQCLHHLADDQLLQNLEELKAAFEAHVIEANSNHDNDSVAVWSTVCGYCEALTTHKDPTKRFRIYPIPIDALRRLVNEEFVPFCQKLKEELDSYNGTLSPADKHRKAVRTVANAVWKKAHGKSRDARDELHANSLYVCFRGTIDKVSLDCFGAAVVTTAALQRVLNDSKSSSFLTLSEDHAYESHCLDTPTKAISSKGSFPSSLELGTCEIAIPGNTKEVQLTRGLDVAEALMKANKRKSFPYEVTAETSWLYMRKHAVVCNSIPMALAALAGNINSSIVTKNITTKSTLSEYFASGPLLDMKRELLWTLKDHGHLQRFPYAVMELAECEDHRSTARGLDWVDVADMGIQDKVMGVEQLYLEAMSISRVLYGDSQAYPYFCAAHYHKDAIWAQSDKQQQSPKDPDINSSSSYCDFNPEQEYRLVEAMRLYSEATRVASQYVYDMQLMKQTTKAAILIMNDILSEQDQPRAWCSKSNAIATGTWLIAYYDSLMVWEECCGGNPFCEILTASHKYSIGTLFKQFSWGIRKDIIDRLYPASLQGNHDNDPSQARNEANAGSPVLGDAITDSNLRFFSNPRSKRLVQGSPLLLALGKEKVVVREMELVIPMSDEAGRRSKRTRHTTS